MYYFVLCDSRVVCRFSLWIRIFFFFFFFQAEDGIRDSSVTGVQTCALPIFGKTSESRKRSFRLGSIGSKLAFLGVIGVHILVVRLLSFLARTTELLAAFGSDRKSVV